MTTLIENFPRPPDKRQNARRARADAIVKAGGLEEHLNRSASIVQPLAGPRFERQVIRTHALGPRVFGELLIEVAVATGRPDIVADRLQAYAQLDPEIVRALGGDSFPVMPLQVVR